MPKMKIDDGSVSFRIYRPLDDLPFVERTWRSMLDRCPHSFFLSWCWIHTWLKTLPFENNLKFIVGEAGGVTVLAFFLGEAKIVRHGLLRSQTVSLNATGQKLFDNICIEYNGFLVDPSYEFSLCDFLAEMKKLPLSWDEFILPGMSGKIYDELVPEKVREGINGKYNLVIARDDPVYWVDLQKVRDLNMDYLQLLSANTRKKVRQSNKGYEINGKVNIEIAADTESALKMFGEMTSLHSKLWDEKEGDGAFSNEFFYKFHHNLITHHYDSGTIQMVHVYNADATIGYLYLFVSGDDILGYQCAFNYSKNNKLSPGTTSLAKAILFYAANNYRYFNFLAGDDQYKQKLTTDSGKMCWATIQKQRKRFGIEKKLKQVKSGVGLVGRK